jgi:hypothetical protein
MLWLWVRVCCLLSICALGTFHFAALLALRIHHDNQGLLSKPSAGIQMRTLEQHITQCTRPITRDQRNINIILLVTR